MILCCRHRSLLIRRYTTLIRRHVVDDAEVGGRQGDVLEGHVTRLVHRRLPSSLVAANVVTIDALPFRGYGASGPSGAG
jgi:tRNA G37 N-methylase TrmD